MAVIIVLPIPFGNVLPAAATLVAPHVEAGFRGGKDRAFYYGHTFCGHPLGAALAREVLRIYRDEKVLEHAERQGATLEAAFKRLERHPRVLRTRRIGMAAAADLAPSSGGTGGYLGGVWAAVHAGIPAGTVALIVGLQPVLTAVWVSARGQHVVAPRQWAGLMR